MLAYSDPAHENDPHKLPDLRIFELTAEEIVELCQDEDMLHDMRKRFPLMDLNSRERRRAIDWAVENYYIVSGWFFQYCYPGCLPDSDAFGPYDSADLALSEARAMGGIE